MKSAIQKEPSINDSAFQSTLEHMKNDVSHIWTSVEIYSSYLSFEGQNMSRRTLVQNLSEHFSTELVVLSSPGIADIIMFRSKATALLRIVDENSDDRSVEIVAKHIVRECKQQMPEKDVYNTRVDKTSASDEISPTLLLLLSTISDKLNNTLPAVLIGNILESIIINRPTTLQIALGVLLLEKSLNESFNDFGVTCSYREVLRLKTSAATAAVEQINSSTRSITDS